MPALTKNGQALPYMHFGARSRDIPAADIYDVFVEEMTDKRGVLVPIYARV